MAKTVIDITNVIHGFREIVAGLGVDGQRVIAKEMLNMARYKYPQAVLRFYPTVLRVRSGNLRMSFEGFADRPDKDTWRIGMRSRNVVYARIQHEGGQINRGRPIEPRRKKALFWEGARHPVRRVNNPGFIPATKFFATPMKRETIPMLERINEKIGFRP